MALGSIELVNICQKRKEAQHGWYCKQLSNVGHPLALHFKYAIDVARCIKQQQKKRFHEWSFLDRRDVTSTRKLAIL